MISLNNIYFLLSWCCLCNNPESLNRIVSPDNCYFVEPITNKLTPTTQIHEDSSEDLKNNSNYSNDTISVNLEDKDEKSDYSSDHNTDIQRISFEHARDFELYCPTNSNSDSVKILAEYYTINSNYLNN